MAEGAAGRPAPGPAAAAAGAAHAEQAPLARGGAQQSAVHPALCQRALTPCRRARVPSFPPSHPASNLLGWVPACPHSFSSSPGRALEDAWCRSHPPGAEGGTAAASTVQPSLRCGAGAGRVAQLSTSPRCPPKSSTNSPAKMKAAPAPPLRARPLRHRCVCQIGAGGCPAPAGQGTGQLLSPVAFAPTSLRADVPRCPSCGCQVLGVCVCVGVGESVRAQGHPL